MFSVPHSRESTPSYSSSWKLQIHIVVIRMRNVSPRLIYLSIWSLVSRASWTGYGSLGMWSLSAGGTHWGWVWRVCSLALPWVHFLPPWLSKIWTLSFPTQLLAALPPMLCRPSMFLSALSDSWWWHFLSFSYCPFVSIPLWDNYCCFYYSLFLRVIRSIGISSFGDTSVFVCVGCVYWVSCFCIHVLHILFLCFLLRERRIYDGYWIQKDQPHIVRTVW